MAELAQFPLSGGGVVVVETDAADLASRRVMRGSSAETAIAAEGVLHQLRSLAEPPDEVAVEFGVKMSAETGAVIAKASTEANFKISLSWKKNAPSGK
jgi:hypothetical protein